MNNKFELTIILPAKARDIFDAWLSSEGHSAMTGSPAKVDGQEGGAFSAWDGYILGRILEIIPARRIVQAWRTTEFPEDASDSRVEILLEDMNIGTKLILSHSGMPEDQVESYKKGWDDFYFRPMKEYFAK